MTTPLARVTERVNRGGDVNDPTTPTPLLTLEEFFEGNDAVGSICCNLVPSPTPAQVHEVLKAIRARPEVADVRVAVAMFDSPDWPFSETVWVMTSASPETVWSWFPEDLRPSETWAGWTAKQRFEPYAPPPGTQPVGCWWD